MVQGFALALEGYGGSIGPTIAGGRQSSVAFCEPGVHEMDHFGATVDASNGVFACLSTTDVLDSVMPGLAEFLTSPALTLSNSTQTITVSVVNPEFFVEARWEWLF
ncbi:hypothetical protein PV04_10185 [Phialophora macrospora]|uniref:Uncharacterized protein n=1 Tax=Phialophora macrospora TaxID=1851006 RepID=A0A0D2CDZ6_9EURO|nr:hypothetical protein PV04_10185 [Phialophora macrospora]